MYGCRHFICSYCVWNWWTNRAVGQFKIAFCFILYFHGVWHTFCFRLSPVIFVLCLMQAIWFLNKIARGRALTIIEAFMKWVIVTEWQCDMKAKWRRAKQTEKPSNFVFWKCNLLYFTDANFATLNHWWSPLQNFCMHSMLYGLNLPCIELCKFLWMHCNATTTTI